MKLLLGTALFFVITNISKNEPPSKQDGSFTKTIGSLICGYVFDCSQL